MARNKCHIIECKTVKFDNEENKQELRAILNNLKNLANYGGSHTKVCLVSYYTIPEITKRRAKEDKIHIIDGESIKRLTEKLQSWIKE